MHAAAHHDVCRSTHTEVCSDFIFHTVYSRVTAGHDAGLRTHILVTLGACLFTITGAGANIDGGADPTRIAAQVRAALMAQ
jgi:hypothetical protein